MWDGVLGVLLLVWLLFRTTLAAKTTIPHQLLSASAEACWEMQSWVCSVVDESTTEPDRLNRKHRALLHEWNNRDRQLVPDQRRILKRVLMGLRSSPKATNEAGSPDPKCVPEEAESSCSMKNANTWLVTPCFVPFEALSRKKRLDLLSSSR